MQETTIVSPAGPNGFRQEVVEVKGLKNEVLEALAGFVVRTASAADPSPEAVATLPAAAELVLDYA